MSTNRIVVLLTPIFAALSGWIAQLITEHFPGAPNLNREELTAVFITGAVAAITAAVKWLEGWQKHEERLND